MKSKDSILAWISVCFLFFFLLPFLSHISRMFDRIFNLFDFLNIITTTIFWLVIF